MYTRRDKDYSTLLQLELLEMVIPLEQKQDPHDDKK